MAVALTCEVLFGAAAADEVVGLVERTTGGPCPCKQGKPCPLAPKTEDDPT